MTSFAHARWLALVLPGGLLAGAYISEYVFGLYPCEMCWWQRWPHFAAVGLASFAFFAPGPRIWTSLAAAAIFVSGLIGGFHAGVEYDWWDGITGCAMIDRSLDVMDPNAAPLVRCDVAPWSLLGISLAGFNFLFSCLGAIAIWVSMLYSRRRATI
ncbi:MAG: disulfide bond formation protein B [Pseudomonadota bacterium]